jgi:S-formylglutathione hydrolase FrmB
MSLLTLHWSSGVLGKQTQAQIIFPDTGKPPFPVLYLLHGLSDDSSMWTRATRLESYASQIPMLIVMPDGYRGFYTDNEQGPAYARHIGEELPTFIERMFPVRAERGGRAIGGLSMGGYGALRVGLGYSKRFCSIHSHSGAVDGGLKVRELKDQESKAAGREFAAEMTRVFGLEADGSNHDLIHLAKRARRNLPKIHLDCGTEDFLIEENRSFVKDLRAAKIPHTYVEHPGGHSWDYWDTHIQEALRFHSANLQGSLEK